MSSFKSKVRDKRTGEEHMCLFLDDYFGRHRYGYKIGNQVLNEDAFKAQYETLERGE